MTNSFDMPDNLLPCIEQINFPELLSSGRAVEERQKELKKREWADEKEWKNEVKGIRKGDI